MALVTLATAGTLTYAASTNSGGTNIVKNTLSKMHLTGSGGWDGEREGHGRMGGRGESQMMGR